jgi:lipopolysaccharide exporter
MCPLNLKQQSISGFFWTGSSAVITTLLQSVQLLVLARLLSPTDFGLMGLVTIITTLGQGLVDAGLSNVVIQRQNLTRQQLSSLYWLNLLAGLAVFLMVLGSIPLIVIFFREPRLYSLLSWASLIFLILPIGQQFQALMQLNLQFQRLARIENFATLLGAGCAIGLALHGAGVYALLGGTMTAIATRALLATAFGWREWHPLRHFKWGDLDDFWAFGFFQMGERFIGYMSNRVDHLLIGKWLGVEALGYYAFASNLILQFVFLLNNLVNRVVFPIFSRIQGDTPRLQNAYLRIVKILGIAAAPAMTGLASIAPTLVPVLFGAHWIPSILVLQILSIAAWIRSISTPLSSLMLARNQARRTFTLNLVLLICLVLAVLAGTYSGSIENVALMVLVMLVLFLTLQYPFFLRNIIGHCFPQYLRVLFLPLVLSIFLGLAVNATRISLLSENSWPHLLGLTGTGVASFLLALWWFDRAQLQELVLLIKAPLNTFTS